MPDLPHDILARTFLALVAAAPFVIVIRSWWTQSYTVVQWVFWATGVYLTRIQWRASLPPRIPVPPGSGAVVVCNHRSSIDPFYTQVLERRVMHWMVAREFLSHPFFGWFLRHCEVIPVGRSGIDTKATKLAIEHARNGRIVGMFPEGRINLTDELMMPCRPGAVLVALRAKVPLIPCYIEGSPYGGTPLSPLLMRARVKVRFGEPIDLAPYAGRERDSALIRDLLLQCMHEIARLAGHDDFEPKVAGKRWRPRDDEAQQA